MLRRALARALAEGAGRGRNRRTWSGRVVWCCCAGLNVASGGRYVLDRENVRQPCNRNRPLCQRDDHGAGGALLLRREHDPARATVCTRRQHLGWRFFPAADRLQISLCNSSKFYFIKCIVWKLLRFFRCRAERVPKIPGILPGESHILTSPNVSQCGIHQTIRASESWCMVRLPSVKLLVVYHI